MENILGAGIVGIVIISLAVFLLILIILIPINIYLIKDILKNIDENLVKSNQMAVHNNKRLKELIEIQSKKTEVEN